jgi:hypothetical protein
MSIYERIRLTESTNAATNSVRSGIPDITAATNSVRSGIPDVREVFSYVCYDMFICFSHPRLKDEKKTTGCSM